MLPGLFLLLQLCAAPPKQLLDRWKQRLVLARLLYLCFLDVGSLLNIPGDELLLVVNVVEIHTPASPL